MANEGDQISDEALLAYAQLFQQPLNDGHIKAVLALFGWEPSIFPLLEHDEMVDGMC